MTSKHIAGMEQKLEKDLQTAMADVIRDNPNLSKEDAFRRATARLLANNPFMPPVGCPINDLPTELLEYIFRLGVEIEDQDKGFDDDEDEAEYADRMDIVEAMADSDADDAMPMVKYGGRKGKILSDNDMNTVPEDDGDEEWESDESEDETYDTDDSNAESDEEETDEDDSEDEKPELTLPFQVLVSHVCRHWRTAALNLSSLWTKLNFLDPPPFEQSREYIRRAKNSPLEICLSVVFPDNWEEEDHPQHPRSQQNPSSIPGDGAERVTPFLSFAEVSQVMDIIGPHVATWKIFEFSVSHYSYMHLVLARLAELPSAPLLEVFQLYHYEDCDDYTAFTPPEYITKFLPFHGNAPNLTDVAFWGVHIDWDASIGMLRGLKDVEFAYHAQDVRPSYATFREIMNACPELRTLTLCLSGPSGSPDLAEGHQDRWPQEPIVIPSLRDLVLCYHDRQTAISLVEHLDVPNVLSLALDYDDEDCTQFVVELMRPAHGRSRSLLAGLEHAKIAGLPCDPDTVDKFYAQLAGLKTLNLNAEDVFFEKLLKAGNATESGSIYCPQLHTITLSGVDGKEIRELVEARKAAGHPLKKVFMCTGDHITSRDEAWLRRNLESLEYFDPSDDSDYSDSFLLEDVDMDDEDA